MINLRVLELFLIILTIFFWHLGPPEDLWEPDQPEKAGQKASREDCQAAETWSC